MSLHKIESVEEFNGLSEDRTIVFKTAGGNEITLDPTTINGRLVASDEPFLMDYEDGDMSIINIESVYAVFEDGVDEDEEEMQREPITKEYALDELSAKKLNKLKKKLMAIANGEKDVEDVSITVGEHALYGQLSLKTIQGQEHLWIEGSMGYGTVAEVGIDGHLTLAPVITNISITA